MDSRTNSGSAIEGLQDDETTKQDTSTHGPANGIRPSKPNLRRRAQRQAGTCEDNCGASDSNRERVRRTQAEAQVTADRLRCVTCVGPVNAGRVAIRSEPYTRESDRTTAPDGNSAITPQPAGAGIAPPVTGDGG